MDNDFVVIEARLMGNGLSWVFGSAGKLEGLGAVECCRVTDFADLVGVHLRTDVLDSVLNLGRVYQGHTPLRVALAAAEALALGFLPLEPVFSINQRNIHSSRLYYPAKPVVCSLS